MSFSFFFPFSHSAYSCLSAFAATAAPLTRPGSRIARSVSNGVVGHRIF